MLEISRKISLPQRNSQPNYIKFGIKDFTESLSMDATSTQPIFKNANGENLPDLCIMFTMHSARLTPAASNLDHEIIQINRQYYAESINNKNKRIYMIPPAFQVAIGRRL